MTAQKTGVAHQDTTWNRTKNATSLYPKNSITKVVRWWHTGFGSEDILAFSASSCSQSDITGAVLKSGSFNDQVYSTSS